MQFLYALNLSFGVLVFGFFVCFLFVLVFSLVFILDFQNGLYSLEDVGSMLPWI